MKVVTIEQLTYGCYWCLLCAVIGVMIVGAAHTLGIACVGLGGLIVGSAGALTCSITCYENCANEEVTI